MQRYAMVGGQGGKMSLQKIMLNFLRSSVTHKIASVALSPVCKDHVPSPLRSSPAQALPASHNTVRQPQHNHQNVFVYARSSSVDRVLTFEGHKIIRASNWQCQHHHGCRQVAGIGPSGSLASTHERRGRQTRSADTMSRAQATGNDEGNRNVSFYYC